MQFPIGVFGVAIATVTLPAVARYHARDELKEAGRTIEEALRLAFFLTVPCTVGLVVLAPQIIEVIYQHIRFTASDTANTAAALRAYAIGVSGYAGIKVLAPCFYALDRPRTPLNVSLLGIGINLVLNFTLIKVFCLGHVGLAVTTGTVALLNFLQLAAYLRRDVAFGTWRRWVAYLLAVTAAAAACGGMAWGVLQYVAWDGRGLIWRAAALGLAIGAGGTAYLGAALALRIEEVHRLAAAIRKRLGR